MTTAIVTDLHLGSRMCALGTPAVRERLLETLARADDVVLLGDVLSLRAAPAPDVLAAARPFFSGLGEALEGRRVAIVPGNHDHQLIAPSLERRRLDPAPPLGLEHLFPPGESPFARTLAEWLGGADLVLAYPGLWVRPDVYAIHGHYLDCHMGVPRRECLGAALMQAVVGRVPPRAAPDDYEAVLAPLYAFEHARSRAGHGQPPRWAVPRGSLVGGLALVGGVAALNAAGLGPFRADVSPAALGRAGVAAMGEVVARLGIEAEHVVFGHIHHAGPLDGEGGWMCPSGARLLNAGGWVWEERLIGDGDAADPHWPGRCVVVPDAGPPEVVSLLAEPALAPGAAAAAGT